MEDLIIKSLGYTIGHNGKNLYLYKLELNKEQFVIYDFREMYTNDNTWVHFLSVVGRTFDSDTLTARVKLQAIKMLPDIEKTNDLRENLDEINHLFFEPDDEDDYEHHYVKPLGIWNGDEVNDMLDVFREFDLTYEGKIKITQKVVDFAREEHGYNLMDELLGYKVKCKTKGKHKNDGQLVEYYFTLTSPDKVKTYFDTEMCLMVGWNYYKDLKLNDDN